MGWNYQRNSSLVSFFFFFSGDSTQLSTSDLHCEAKKLQFVSNTLFVQTGGLDCHSVVTQRKALVMRWCDNKGAGTRTASSHAIFFVTQRAIGKLGENERARAGAGNEVGR